MDYSLMVGAHKIGVPIYKRAPIIMAHIIINGADPFIRAPIIMVNPFMMGPILNGDPLIMGGAH